MGEINKLFILKINLRVILVMKERSIIYLLVWHYLISYLVIKTDGMKLYCGSNKFIWRYINCGLVFFVTLFFWHANSFYCAHTFSIWQLIDTVTVWGLRDNTGHSWTGVDCPVCFASFESSSHALRACCLGSTFLEPLRLSTRFGGTRSRRREQMYVQRVQHIISGIN